MAKDVAPRNSNPTFSHCLSHPTGFPIARRIIRRHGGSALATANWKHLSDEEYEVCIDSTLEPGHLTYGEYRIQGETDNEVLISCHSCHPSLCNDNLSGMVDRPRVWRVCCKASLLRYSYRFLWIPGTIGSITWLARNEATLPRIKHGLVLSCVGDAGPFTYKRSRRGNAEVDRAVEHVLRHSNTTSACMTSLPMDMTSASTALPALICRSGASCERQMDAIPSTTPRRMISASSPRLRSAESLLQLLRVIQVLEENNRYLNLNPKCEPQLGRRGLYRQIGGIKDAAATEMAMLWILNLSDGKHDLLDIAIRSGIPFYQISEAAELLRNAGLLKEIPPE